MRKRRTVVTAVAVLAALAILFVATELALRLGIAVGVSWLRRPELYGSALEDEDYWKLRYRWRPDTTPLSVGFVTDPELGWQPRRTPQNPLAVLADEPYSIEPTAGSVLFFGDSFVHGVDPAMVRQRIPQQLDRLLPERPVYNYGVPGYGLDQIYLRFQKTHGSFADPSIVVGLLTLDLDRAIFAVHSAPKPHFELEEDRLVLTNVPLPASIANWYERNPPALESYLVALVARTYRNARNRGSDIHSERYVERKRAINSRILAALVAEASSHRRSLVIVLFYSRRELDFVGWRETFLKRELDRLGLTYVDTKGIFAQAAALTGVDPDAYYYLENGHLNEIGNCLVAEAVAGILANGRSDERPGERQSLEAGGIVAVAPQLAGRVRVEGPVSSPWPLESLGGPRVSCFEPVLLWLGEGESGAVSFELWAERRERVRIELDLVPGSGRHDARRTCRLTLDNRLGRRREQRRIERPTSLRHDLELEPGSNRFEIAVLDRATVAEQPNGDTRPLLMQLRQIRIFSADSGSPHSSAQTVDSEPEL